MNSFKLESGTLSLSSTDTGTITFSMPYNNSPTVVVIAESDVNVYVESVSTTEATIKTSAIYSGDIQYQVIAND